MIRFSLDDVKKSKATSELNFINRGIEKESLRIDSSGKISQKPHPQRSRFRSNKSIHNN